MLQALRHLPLATKARASRPVPSAAALRSDAADASYEEAAEFWDTHDTMDYPDSFEDVPVHAELKRRRFEVEVVEDLMKVLSVQAHERGVTVSRLVNEMLRERIHA